MVAQVREIIKQHTGILIQRICEVDMIADYFAYAIIHGEDVAPEV